MGFPAHAMPLFAARPVGWRAPAAQDFDALLLTSAFAARLAGPEIARPVTLPVHAVGDAAARAAEAAGLTVAMSGTAEERQRLGQGKRGAGRVEHGGRRTIKQQTHTHAH